MDDNIDMESPSGGSTSNEASNPGIAVQARTILGGVRWSAGASRWVVGIASVGLTAVVVVVALTDGVRQAGERNVAGSGNLTAPCAQVGDNSVCLHALQGELDRVSGLAPGDDDALRAELRKDPLAGQPPSGDGPFPFVVVDTAALGGLYARTSNVLEAARVGTAANRSIVWADCLAVTDFSPPGVTGETAMGPKWLHVRWRHLPVSNERGHSEPDQEQRAWMYRGATEPIRHNGVIPDCDQGA
ncbi:MAG: hypothetical protein HOV94_37205 [Saccharothrix sp.]|nr:hypothetical protein [Saccharothrix sp.]